MRPVIEFSECLFDSPKFRSQLQKNETNLDDLESKLEKILKLSNTMNDTGRQFITHQSQFVAGLWELSAYFASDLDEPSEANQGHLNKLIGIVQETIKFQNAALDAASKAINVNLQRFLKEDMRQMKDTRGYFNKISNDLDGALNKNAGASKSRPLEVEDATNFLTATQGCFRYTTLDYVYQVRPLFLMAKSPIIF